MSTHDDTTADPAEAPDRFAGDTIGEVIGWGGFATVHRLHDPRTGAPTDQCIKIGHDLPPRRDSPPPDSPPPGAPSGDEAFPTHCIWANSEFVGLGTADPDEIRSVLIAEYAYLRDHPHDLFPRVGAAGTVHGLPCYTMEYLTGPTLRQRLAVAAPPDRVALLPGFTRLVGQLGALRAADRTFVHGDLKPENIVVTGDQWRLIDPARGKWTNEFPGLCTLAYNPWPDPWSNSERPDMRALAIVLFEIVAGWQPFATLSGSKWTWRSMDRKDKIEIRACLESERWACYAAEPFFGQLLAWMRTPPPYEDLAAFLHAHPHGPAADAVEQLRAKDRAPAQGIVPRRPYTSDETTSKWGNPPPPLYPERGRDDTTSRESSGEGTRDATLRTFVDDFARALCRVSYDPPLERAVGDRLARSNLRILADDEALRQIIADLRRSSPDRYPAIICRYRQHPDWRDRPFDLVLGDPPSWVMRTYSALSWGSTTFGDPDVFAAINAQMRSPFGATYDAHVLAQAILPKGTRKAIVFYGFDRLPFDLDDIAFDPPDSIADLADAFEAVARRDVALGPRYAAPLHTNGGRGYSGSGMVYAWEILGPVVKDYIVGQSGQGTD